MRFLVASHVVLWSILTAPACGHPTVREPPPPAPAPEATWPADMERRHQGFAAQPVVELRAVASQATPGFTKVELPIEVRASGQPAQVFVADTPLIDSRFVRGAHVVSSSEHFGIEVVMEWNEEGRRKFKEISAAHVGQKIALVLHGRPFSFPVVKETIDSPHITLLLRNKEREELPLLLRELNPRVDRPALLRLRKRCEQRHVQACLLIAKESLLGRDLPFDKAAAAEAYEAACNLGDGAACAQAVTCLAPTGSREHQVEQVKSLLRRGCDLSHWSSCRGLAKVMLEFHPVTQAVRAEARTLLARACEKRVGEACKDLAKLVFEQEGRKALPQILALAEQACTYGQWDACEELGDMALEREPPDLDAALKWYKAACATDKAGSAFFVPCEPSARARKQLNLKTAAGCEIRKGVCTQASKADSSD